MRGAITVSLMSVAIVVLLCAVLIILGYIFFFGGEDTFLFGFKEALAQKIRDFIGIG